MLSVGSQNQKLWFSLLPQIYFRVFNQQKLLFSSAIKTYDFPPAYVPSFVEAGKYEIWERNKISELFKEKSEICTLLMPPPNITGTLHLGHALTLLIQDVLIRWKTMCGTRTVWVPGFDHAGIATQVIVEKKLWKEKRQTRHDLGREQFEQEVWNWKKQMSCAIEAQIRRLGALPDWRRQYFTMDERQSRAVVEAFIRLFDSGLIYRSDYLVNWSCVLQSAISDVEVEYLDISGRKLLSVPGYEGAVEFGLLTTVAYKLFSTDEELLVATTRPETILGDVAVAVHPSDDRYSRFIGQQVIHPLTHQSLPVICDDFVDPEFGTGVVKVTPAHDPADFQVGKRHGLPLLQVIDEKGLILWPGQYQHMKRFDARRSVVQYLDQQGLLRGVVEHPMKIPICSRSGDILEYLVRPQWFISCREMALRAAQHVRDGSLVIEPTVFHTNWFNWLENIRDWCISRQLWWGHRIPAYRCHLDEPQNGQEVWVAADNVENARQKAALKLNAEPNRVVLVQDEDVLDTWFSSALLPAAVFGWPDQTTDLKTFYPLSMMETGHDILFFWVARMVMLGLELTGKLPFNKVLLHGIICDAHGRKMSKSLGNVISPEDVIEGKSIEGLEQGVREAHQAGLVSVGEMDRAVKALRTMFPIGIPECGADALRFTLCSHNIKCHFINFDVIECHTNKLFCNKIWQACKFMQLAYDRLNTTHPLTNHSDIIELCIMDRWILSRMSRLVAEVNAALHRNDFHVATAALKQFLYTELCDVFVEATKPVLRSLDGSSRGVAVASGHVATLGRCLNVGLRVLAPFMPYVAEHLYQLLPSCEGVEKGREGVHSAEYPQVADYRDPAVEQEVEMALEAVTAIRRLRKLYNITAKLTPKAFIITTNSVYTSLRDVIATLSGCKALEVLEEAQMDSFGMTSVSETLSNNGVVYVFVPVEYRSRTDVVQGERTVKNIEKLQIEIEKMTKMVCSGGYRSKAPLNVQEGHKTKLAALEGELERLRQLHRT